MQTTVTVSYSQMVFLHVTVAITQALKMTINAVNAVSVSLCCSRWLIVTMSWLAGTLEWNEAIIKAAVIDISTIIMYVKLKSQG